MPIIIVNRIVFVHFQAIICQGNHTVPFIRIFEMNRIINKHFKKLRLISGDRANPGLFNHVTFRPFQSRVPVPLMILYRSETSWMDEEAFP
jgi:hypothetical protein